MPKVGGLTSQKTEGARAESKQIIDTMNKSYISAFIATLNEINQLDEYKIGQEPPFIKALQAYNEFINCYLKEVLVQLKIHPRKEFYSKKYFTCAVIVDSDQIELHQEGNWFPLRGVYLDKVIAEVASLLGIYTENPAIKEKLGDAESAITSILSYADALTIIHGVIKLTIILGDAQLLHESKLDFDMHLRPGVNAFVDFLLMKTASCYQIDPAMIYRNLLAQGTARQRQKMQDMINCCEKYCDQLKAKSSFNEHSGLIEAAQVSSQLYLFQILVQSLRKIHLDREYTASEKIRFMTLEINGVLNRAQVKEREKDDKMLAPFLCSINRLMAQSVSSVSRTLSKCPYSFYVDNKSEPSKYGAYQSASFTVAQKYKG